MFVTNEINNKIRRSKMKKIIQVIVLSLVLMGCTAASTWAGETESTDFSQNEVDTYSSSKVEISEYDEMETLSKLSEVQLKGAGYTTSEIVEIQLFQQLYDKHIYSLKEMSSSSLAANGYTEEQIKAIHSYDGTKAKARLASAKVQFTTAKVDSLSYSKNYTRGKVSYSWKWTGIPAFKMKDIVAISWNNWELTDDYGTVTYYKKSTGKATSSAIVTKSSDGNGVGGRAHKFKMSANDNTEYAKQGAGYFKIKSDVQAKKNLRACIAYGHTKLNAKVGFTVTPTGASPGISFSMGTSKIASKPIRKNCE